MELINKSFLWLVLILLISCNEKNDVNHSSRYNSDTNAIVVPKDSTKLMQTLGLVHYKNEPFTGTTTVKLKSGMLVESNSYRMGKRNGLYKKWFTDGTLSFEASYVGGKQNDITRTWWRNGNLRSESNFKNGTPHGMQNQWYKSGAKFKRMVLVDGKEEGMQKSWRENGKIYNNYEAKNGRIFGLKKSTLCFQLAGEKLKSSN